MCFLYRLREVGSKINYVQISLNKKSNNYTHTQEMRFWLQYSGNKTYTPYVINIVYILINPALNINYVVNVMFTSYLSIKIWIRFHCRTMGTKVIPQLTNCLYTIHNERYGKRTGIWTLIIHVLSKSLKLVLSGLAELIWINDLQRAMKYASMHRCFQTIDNQLFVNWL